MTHQQRTAVSVVTGPDGAHAPPQLPDGDLFVGHDVSKVGAHLWKKRHAERPPQAFPLGTPERHAQPVTLLPKPQQALS